MRARRGGGGHADGGAHREAITLFEGYGKNGDDPRLKRLAEETAPALKAHLEAVKAAQGH